MIFLSLLQHTLRNEYWEEKKERVYALNFLASE
jgi:hypothetical protein